MFHITKPKPFDADKAWSDHLDRVGKRDPIQWPTIFHTTYPFSRYPLYLVYSKRPPPAADKYDPHRAWLDHLDRLAELDKLYPSLWPAFGSSRLSPTPIKVTHIIVDLQLCSFKLKFFICINTHVLHKSTMFLQRKKPFEIRFRTVQSITTLSSTVIQKTTKTSVLQVYQFNEQVITKSVDA